jgi:hypothetical protein
VPRTTRAPVGHVTRVVDVVRVVRVVTTCLIGGVVASVVGCGPSAECRAYVECQRAVDDDVDVAAWDEGGTCWQQSPRVAAECTAQCRVALDALRALPDAPPVCND